MSTPTHSAEALQNIIRTLRKQLLRKNRMVTDIHSLARQGLDTDGVHHKQWVLSEILALVAPKDYQARQEAGKDLGVAP